MPFTLISHGPSHLHLASIEGHRLLFNIIRLGQAREVACGGVQWSAGRQPSDCHAFMAEAASFAAFCAQDYGLI